MRILVTRGTGFIGGHLIEKLAASNHDIVCMIRKTNDTSHLDKLVVETRVGDLDDPNSLEKVPKDVDVTYHLGAYYTRSLNIVFIPTKKPKIY